MPSGREIKVEDQSSRRFLLVKAAGTLGLLAVGVAIAFGLYQDWWGIAYSWGDSNPLDRLVAAGIGGISAALLVAWILYSLGKLNFRFSAQTLMSISIIWIGFGSGLFGPAALGRDGGGGREVIASVIYQAEIRPLKFPDGLEEFLGTRPGPYIASASMTQHYAILNKPGALGLEEGNAENATGRVALAFFSSLDSELDIVDWIVLTDLDPRIQNVRDVQPTNRGLVFTNVELKNDCLVLQVWSADLSEGSLRNMGPTMVWESNPCLTSDMNPAGGVGLHQSGARLVVEPSGSVLVAVGDFAFGLSITGEYEGRPDPLGPNGSYGKILRINPDGSEQVISTGHRNPQGLFFDEMTSRLWSTEHGPNAGGELNLVIEGKDYGWPDVTYGVPYLSPNLPEGDWEIGRWGGGHDGFEKPRLAWMPSVAPSQLLVYRGEEFPGWHGDLLIATLKDESIRRIRLDGTRVVFDERIAIGKRDADFRRIRDMVELGDGRLLLSFDSGELAVLSLAKVP